jgi:hypothetical protein
LLPEKLHGAQTVPPPRTVPPALSPAVSKHLIRLNVERLIVHPEEDSASRAITSPEPFYKYLLPFNTGEPWRAVSRGRGKPRCGTILSLSRHPTPLQGPVPVQGPVACKPCSACVGRESEKTCTCRSPHTQTLRQSLFPGLQSSVGLKIGVWSGNEIHLGRGRCWG